MIDTQSLRGKILDRALHGELTCQLPEDGTGAQLYQEIIEKRKELSKAGRIKNLKKLPEVSEDEWLFEIPQSWKWIRLGNVASIFGGKRIPAGRKLTTEDTGHKYIRVSEMKNETVIIEDMLYVPEDIYPSISQYIINKEDVYITVAGTIGRVGKIPEEIDGANLTENADRIVFDMIDQDWLISCLSSSEIQKEISLSTTQVAQPKLAIKRIEDLIIPLPPLNEQKRMVHILNQVFPILDTINALQDQYASNQEALKSKLIDAGIQGKLTEQLPDDGTGEELYQQIISAKKELEKEGKIKKCKKLPEISLDEIPFDIPCSWRWVRLGDICSKIVDGDHNPPKGIKQKTEYLMASAININHDRIENLDSVRYLSKDVFDEENKRTNLQINDVLLTIVGTMGRSCVYEGGLNLCFQRSVSVITTLVNSRYIKRVLDTSYIQKFMQDNATGAAQLGFYLNKVEKLIIPLPPIQEQQRIVDAIDSMLIQMNG